MNTPMHPDDGNEYVFGFYKNYKNTLMHPDDIH